MTDNMETHIVIIDCDEYFIGQGVEYPGITISGESPAEIERKYLEILPGHIDFINKIAHKVKQANVTRTVYRISTSTT